MAKLLKICLSKPSPKTWGHALAAAFLVFVALLPLAVHNQYYLNVFLTIMINAVLAMCFLVVLRTGLINVSMAGFWGIGAYGMAVLEIKVGLSFWIALPIVLVMGALLALILGLLVMRFAGFGFVILTLVIASIVPVVFGTFEYFGQHVGMLNIPPPSAIPLPGGGHIQFTSFEPFYYLGFALALIVALVFWAFYSAWTGRAWRALGLSSQLAQSVGINPFRYRLIAWILGSAAAILIGAFYAAYAGAIVPDSFGPFKAIYAQFYAILGGVGFVLLGPIVGALILTVIPEFLRPIGGNEPIVTGVIVILLVIFLPQGLIGTLASVRTLRAPANLFRSVSLWARRGAAEGPPGAPEAAPEPVKVPDLGEEP